MEVLGVKCSGWRTLSGAVGRRQLLYSARTSQVAVHCRLDFKTGDIILLRDKQVHRNKLPMGVLVETLHSADGRERKA